MSISGDAVGRWDVEAMIRDAGYEKDRDISRAVDSLRADLEREVRDLRERVADLERGLEALAEDTG